MELCGHANICMLADDKVIPDGWVPYRYFVEKLDKLVAMMPAAPDNKEDKK